jgi:hypothetical protein
MIARFEMASTQPKALAFSSMAIRKLMSLNSQTNASVLLSLDAGSIQQRTAARLRTFDEVLINFSAQSIPSGRGWLPPVMKMRMGWGGGA